MKTERYMYVAYYTKKGQFRTKTSYTDDFTKARMYNMRGHLSSSVGKHNIESGEVIPVPIRMVIPKETLITLKLGGSVDDLNI